MAGLWLYLTGVILGRARRRQLGILARMFSDPGSETGAVAFLSDLAVRRMDNYGKEPSSFYDFFMTTEYQKAGIEWPADYRGAIRVGKQRMPLKKVEPSLKMLMLEGIGFGAKFPELAEQMWRQTLVTFGTESWEMAREHGLDIPEQFTPLPMKEREQQVLVEVAQYATEYFPELLEPLHLNLT